MTIVPFSIVGPVIGWIVALVMAQTAPFRGAVCRAEAAAPFVSRGAAAEADLTVVDSSPLSCS